MTIDKLIPRKNEKTQTKIQLVDIGNGVYLTNKECRILKEILSYCRGDLIDMVLNSRGKEKRLEARDGHITYLDLSFPDNAESYLSTFVNRLPESIKDLRKLEYIDLSGNKMMELPKFLLGLSNLKTFGSLDNPIANMKHQDALIELAYRGVAVHTERENGAW